GEVMKSILPFYSALFLAMALVTYVPMFSMWLPRLLMH
ncbi:TRAP-type C4-dicarboxylate transport system permease large subunit, partial [Rhizobium wenxiniae]|nr:TRAP-type C4-dicarboxylate transport system permease large subunit [Rhizobium wenxiniae]